MSAIAPWWSRLLDGLTHRLPYGLRLDRSWAFGFVLGSSLFVASASLAYFFREQWQRQHIVTLAKRPIELRRNEVLDGVTSLIGNTPLVRIKSLCELTGHEILGKAEYLNPGGSPKDRVALRIIEQAEEDGLLYAHTGSTIFEGTVGSTGISIALVARAKGYRACIIIPDDVAPEKAQVLERLGAIVDKVRPVSIVSQDHFVNLAKRKALHYGKIELVGPEPTANRSHRRSMHVDQREDLVVTSQAMPTIVDPDVDDDDNVDSNSDNLQDSSSKPRGFFADQFENLANFDAHYHGTGPEIWRQTNGTIDAFVAGAGTGGTLAGVATALKEVKPTTRIVLADPQGSGLYNKIRNGVMYASTEAEGTRRRHQVDTVVEGIGINRITANMQKGLHLVDDAIRVTDFDAVVMSRHLVEHDGLFLGSSSAVNLVAACRLAKSFSAVQGKKTIVTILCDSGSRHYSKFWNDEYLRKASIVSSDTPLPSLRDIL